MLYYISVIRIVPQTTKKKNYYSYSSWLKIVKILKSIEKEKIEWITS